jgi:enoyl-CoA hydratase/carnithine racemase
MRIQNIINDRGLVKKNCLTIRNKNMHYNFIKTHIENHIFRLTLARPEKRNAFTPTMVNEINHAIKSANEAKEVRLVMIDAEGPVFCAGMDLKAFTDPENDTPNPRIENQSISLGEAMSQLNKPSIALVEGNVMAGGFLIILECTYVFAKPGVQFSLPEVKIGIFPFQVLASLLKIMPQNKAMDLCISGRPFSAEEAKKMGIVYDFFETEKVDSVVENLVQNAPLAITRGFEALKALGEIKESEKFSFLLESLNQLRGSEDAQEGIKAMFEKRKPEWKNQ